VLQTSEGIALQMHLNSGWIETDKFENLIHQQGDKPVVELGQWWAVNLAREPLLEGRVFRRAVPYNFIAK